MSESRALIQFNQDERQLLRRTIAPGTTDDQFELFVQVCRQTGLNPFARQIYAVVRNEKQRDGSYVPKMVIQTSIDGYRLLAQRSREYTGQDGPYWYDEQSKQWVDVWLASTPPVAAKVGVMRKGFVQPIYAVARFESYAARAYNKATNKMDGELINLWAKMPEVMIAKVAEALALRRAFPAELSGIYTKEEMDQADHPLPPVQPEREPVIEGEAVEVSGQAPTDATEQQLSSIRKLCERLGKPEPADALTFEAAKELIGQLTQEYRDMKAQPTPEPSVSPARPAQEPPMPDALRAMCERVLGTGKWTPLVVKLFGREVTDDDLTPPQCERIHQALVRHESQKATQPANAGGGR